MHHETRYVKLNADVKLMVDYQHFLFVCDAQLGHAADTGGQNRRYRGRHYRTVRARVDGQVQGTGKRKVERGGKLDSFGVHLKKWRSELRGRMHSSGGW